MPGLIWNTMMSMSGGWFFVVASEAITVGNTPSPARHRLLCRTGIQKQNLPAIGYAILTMLLVIIAYDQLLFRPVVAWADKFRFEQTASASAPTSWMLDLFRRTRLCARCLSVRRPEQGHLEFAYRAPAAWKLPAQKPPPSRIVDASGLPLIVAGTGYAAWRIYEYLSATLGPSDVLQRPRIWAITLTRVIVLIALATLIWVPVGVWIGLRPKLAERIQPLAQFLAAFPANLAFPVFVVMIVRYGLNAECLAQPADDSGNAVVHPVQCHRGRQRIPDRSARGRRQLSPPGWRWWTRSSCPAFSRIISPAPSPPRADPGMPASSPRWQAGATPI